MKSLRLALASIFLLSFQAEAITWEEARLSAVSGNTSLKQADFDLQKSDEVISENRSGYFPNVRASYSKSRTIDQNPSASSTSNRLAVTASQNIFAGLADVSATNRAEATRTAYNAAKINVSIAQRANLRKEFDYALYLQDAAALASRTVARRAENVRIVNLRYDGGRENKSSALKTQASQLLAEADQKYYRASLDISRSQISRLTGRPIPSTELFSGSLDRSGDSVTSVNGDHPKILQAAANRDAATYSVKEARAGWLPSVTADASAYRAGMDNAIEPDNHFSLALTLTLPIFSASQSPRYRESTIELSKAELSLAEARSDLDIEFRRAVINLENSLALRDVAVKVLEAAKMQAEVYRQRYTLGMVTFQDWDTAEGEYIKAEKDLLAARRDLADAWTSMDQAKGRTLEDSGP